MSTVKQPLDYLWTAYFDNEEVVEQPEDDHYSKSDPSAEWNPSAFRDVRDRVEAGIKVDLFVLHGDGVVHTLDLVHGKFTIDGVSISLGDESDRASDRKLIYFRNVEKQWIDGIEYDPKIVSYTFGYEYTDTKGRVQKKVIELDG